jgi:hypothetical protein
LEESLNIGDKFFVSQEHNDMIALLNTQIVISYHDIITAYNGANDGSWGKFNLIDRSADYP